MPSGATQLIKSKLLFARAQSFVVDVLKEFKKVVQKLLSTHFKISQMCKRPTHTRTHFPLSTNKNILGVELVSWQGQGSKVLFDVLYLIKRKGVRKAQKLTATRRAQNNKWKVLPQGLKGGVLARRQQKRHLHKCSILKYGKKLYFKN